MAQTEKIQYNTKIQTFILLVVPTKIRSNKNFNKKNLPFTPLSNDNTARAYKQSNT